MIRFCEVCTTTTYAIDRYVTRLTQEARHEGDRQEIERQFEQEMGDDLKRLRDELGLEAKRAILSNEVLVCVLAAVGAVIEPFASTIIEIDALLRTRANYRAARRKALTEHAMSWLDVAKNRVQVL